MLSLWIEFFEDLQHVRGRSQNTVMAYKHDLELWNEYKKNSGSVSGFYEFLKKNKLSTRSQARVISSLRTYLKFCENNGIKSPELRELRPPKVSASLPKPLSAHDFDKLFHACIVSGKGAADLEAQSKTLRNHLTLLFLYGLGVRVSELIGLNIHDFNATESWIRVLGKGKKERLVPLTENLRVYLKAYLETARPTLIKESSPAILINDRGHRPSRIDIWRWLAAWSAKAGFEEPVHPHRFRHGCATALLEGGADLRSIQILLGHSSIQTTQVYTNVTTNTVQKSIEQHHPLSKIEI